MSLAKLVGANWEFIFNRIPRISHLMVDNIDAVLNHHAQTIVIENSDSDFHGLSERLRDGRSLVDFVRITGPRSVNGNYAGICW